MAEDDPDASKSIFRTIFEHGPAWITAITGAVLATAWIPVGRATGGSDKVSPPTATVTRTTDSGAVPRPAAPATAASSSASASPPAPAPAPAPAPTPAPTPAPASGALLGSYSITLSDGYSVPLGPQQPVQAQFTQTMSAGDLHFNGFDYSPGRAGEQLVSLPNGTTPTYKACSTATTFTSSVADTQGASFCILEEDGDFAGVYVAADQSGYAQLQASVWQGAPPVG